MIVYGDCMEKLNINNLTIKQVNALIKSEKNPPNVLKYNDVYKQIVEGVVYTGHTYKCEVRDVLRKISYNLLVHTTPIETHFSISLMFTENHFHLIRFDFGDNLRHTNYAGTDHEKIVVGSHVHYNASPQKYAPKNVVPIEEIDEFKNIKIIKDAFVEFLKYTNIKEKS